MTDQTMAHLEQVQRLFDEKAPTWGANYAPHGRLTGRLTQLADAVGYRVAAGGRVLDLGCGSGELSRYLAAAGLRMTGCDISANMLARAAASDPSARVELVRLAPDWHALPFAAATFDAIVASSVLEYVRSPGSVLQECARVLRPGGVMLCTVPDPTHPVRWLEWFASLAAPTATARTAGRRWPRLGRYLTYLQISRQRRSARWWSAAATQAGLFTIPRPAGTAERSPLRLFTFERPTDPRGEPVTPAVMVDIAGAAMGGAARYATELRSYLARTGRADVRVVGEGRRVDPRWLVRREISAPAAARRVAVNNVSFVAPGGSRRAVLRNALHFLTDVEAAALDPALRASVRRDAAVVRLAARRADVLVVPCTAMAERVRRVLPAARDRILVRAHPVSADSIPALPRDPAILCPLLFAPYKRMDERLQELLAALDDCGEPLVRIRITASRGELSGPLAFEPRIEFLGRIGHHELRQAWARSRAIYFPTGLESFGYPLAEARVSGHPVIALDTAQNREIAGNALRGFSPTNPDSLRHAVKLALTSEVSPDPGPFDPDAYFDWLLGGPR